MSEMSEDRCRAIAREVIDDHQKQHQLEGDIYLSTKDFNKEHQLLSAKVVALEIQLSNIRTAVYVVMAILGSTVFLGLWKWAVK